MSGMLVVSMSISDLLQALSLSSVLPIWLAAPEKLWPRARWARWGCWGCCSRPPCGQRRRRHVVFRCRAVEPVRVAAPGRSARGAHERGVGPGVQTPPRGDALVPRQHVGRGRLRPTIPATSRPAAV